MTVNQSESVSRNLSRSQVVDLAKQWIDNKIPGAIVRFGDGESRLLCADPNDLQSIHAARSKVYRQTGLRLPTEDILEIKSLLIRAFDEADVLGIEGDVSIKEEHRIWLGRIEKLLYERLPQRGRPPFVSHCLVSVDLSNALPTLLSGLRKVSVVSCRNIKPEIKSRCDIEDVCIYQIPSQFIVRAVDDSYEAALHGVPIWPEFYQSLCDRLSVREPGEVFLVGAGLFGKDLCIRIRELGGIALDLGSCLDKMVGKVTRGKNAPHRRQAQANNLLGLSSI